MVWILYFYDIRTELAHILARMTGVCNDLELKLICLTVINSEVFSYYLGLLFDGAY